VVELYFVAASLAILVSYHLRLLWNIRHAPQETAYSRHRQTRQRWVESYGTKGNEIMVVQTLRNWIMSSTFQASTAMLLALGLLGVGITSERLSGLVTELNMFGSHAPKILLIKLLALAIGFLIAFFAYSLAIRSLIHSGFMINLLAGVEDQNDLRRAQAELQRSAYFQFIGLRCYYMSMPLFMWIIGPAWMLAGSIVLVLLLLKVD
jgi:uncharacterized membrane protein